MLFNKHFLVVFLLLTPAVALANPQLTIVNHVGKDLKFIVGINPEVLPDLPSTFYLRDGLQMTTSVVDLGKSAYIRAEEGNEHSAFWAVEVQNNAVKLHGYVSKGVAFSWNQGPIVFCTPEDYKKNGECI